MDQQSPEALGGVTPTLASGSIHRSGFRLSALSGASSSPPRLAQRHFAIGYGIH